MERKDPCFHSLCAGESRRPVRGLHAGVAAPCLEIQKDVDKSYEYTRRGNLVAVVTDAPPCWAGGHWSRGRHAGDGGQVRLFSAFAGIDAFPICVGSKDVDEIVRTVELIAGSFGGINLEDIAAPPLL